LIRHARHADDSRAYNALLPLLLARCEAILNNKIDSEMPGAVELREDILGDFAELFAIDGTEHDRHKLNFFEIRFNMAFSTFRITRVRQALGRSEVPLPEPSEEIELTEQEADKEVTKRLDELQADDGNPEGRVFRKQVLQAIIDLPPDERRAVVLVYLLGSTREAAAKLCDVDERTIRNRLKRAFAKLSKKLKEDA
jgi:RNA polymerase sigma factor (sigma-70 family)